MNSNTATMQAPGAWGTRLGDAIRAALAAGDPARAQRLAAEGDGLARDLAREYGLMSHGLVFTATILLQQLRDAAAPDPATGRGLDDTAAADLDRLRQRLLDGLQTPAPCEQALSDSQRRLMADQARQAEAVVQAIAAGDLRAAIAGLDAKDDGWLAWHDPVVRFMADSFAWVLTHAGPRALLEFHLATAEAQRAGFDKWERMPPETFAATTALLLRQHMGQVDVLEDERRFTIRQSPCGSGGRLRIGGAYAGPQALPFVETSGPLTFGEPRMPVYCTHCAIWNGSATLRWYGRAQWVLDEPARADGGCTLHIYKRRDDAPADYTRRVGLPPQGDAS